MQTLEVKQLDFDQLIEQFETFLIKRIKSPALGSSRLQEAIEYVVLSGGKRLRPLLVYTTGLALGAEISDLHRPATAVELIHCYSLTHDDLPAMDNDTLRRGKPTCHIAFDEATAILAGDALQCLAFDILSEPYASKIPDKNRLKMIRYLSSASGLHGMAGGQSLDLAATGLHVSIQDVEKIHSLKTGKLIQASIMLGAYCSHAPQKVLDVLETFADKIGLAYQIHDDILDIESTTKQLGKTQGADQKLKKATYPSIVGLEESKNIRDWLCQKATSLLNKLDFNTNDLNRLVEMMIHRPY